MEGPTGRRARGPPRAPPRSLGCQCLSLQPMPVPPPSSHSATPPPAYERGLLLDTGCPADTAAWAMGRRQTPQTPCFKVRATKGRMGQQGTRGVQASGSMWHLGPLTGSRVGNTSMARASTHCASGASGGRRPGTWPPRASGVEGAAEQGHGSQRAPWWLEKWLREGTGVLSRMQRIW